MKLNMYTKLSLCGLLLSCMMLSCNSQKEVIYFQDVEVNKTERMAVQNPPRIVAEPFDNLDIVVNSKDPEVTSMFTLYSPNKRFNATDANLATYSVDPAGYIDFPVLGKLKVGGLDKYEIADLVKQELVRRDLVKDPVVIADLDARHYNVTGDISAPGQYEIDEKGINILQAISKAGDLTITGRRDNVKVIRQEKGERTVYEIDLRSKELFDSPAYWLHDGDVVYIEPNEMKAGQSSTNENFFKSVGFYISLASLLTSIAILIIR